MTIFCIIYGLIALGFGYFMSRESWRKGGKDYDRHSFFLSLLLGLVFGGLWIALLLGFLLYCLCQQSFWERLGNALWGSGR